MVENSYNQLHPTHFNPSHFHRADIVDQPLYVVVPVYDPMRYRSRWKLYLDFENYVLSNNEAHLVTIECALGERAFVLKKNPSNKHTLIQVRTKDDLWFKENMLNVAISRLPIDWKYACYIDGDIEFVRPDWVGECLHLLQRYSFLQMHSEVHDLDSNYNVIRSYNSFGYCYHNQDLVPPFSRKMYYVVGDKLGKGYWHPGHTMAFRREAFDAVGGLIDWGILGGGDTFMWYCLGGLLNKRIMPNSLGPNGVRWLQEWQSRCDQYIKKNIGYMDGAVNHYWHGSRKDRAYWDRGYILTSAAFDPEKDIKKDAQGLWQLSGNNIVLRDGIRRYLSQRNEDSIN
jgi:hypothetical protein